MDNGLEIPLTLVSAPAGYGKSTLVSHWLESLSHPNAWLSLDVDDSDLTVFTSYLIAAIRTLFPDACRETEALIAAPKLPPVSVLGGYLVNELDEIDTSFVLTLDDYHHIAPMSDVHELIGFILNHPPALLRLVIVTRRDPPLTIASMRASRRLTDVRAKDLKFSKSDITAFLEITAGLSIGEEALANLLQQTEGWAVGLQLVALHLRHVDDPDGFLKELGGGVNHIREYLGQEVLAERSPLMRDWLLRTSILDTFCPQLCDALRADVGTDEGSDFGGRRFVDELQRNNLFAISLDDQQEWFRYHHLCRDFLNNVLLREWDSEEVAGLHARASAWFAEQGLIDEALRHALDSGEVQSAVRLVERYRYDEMNAERWHRLGRWLKMLPPDTVAENPILLTAEAYICDYHGDLATMIALRERAEGLLSTLQPESLARKSIEGELAALKGEQHIISGEVELAVTCADRALELLPPEAIHIRSFAIGEQVLASQMTGDMGRGLRIITKVLNERASLPGISEARMMLMSCLAYWMEGDLNGLKQSASRCLKLGEQHALPDSMSFGRYFLGVQHYARNELLEAERYLASIVDHPFAARPLYWVHSALALALIHTARGRDEDASSVVESLLSHTMETNDTLGLATVRAFQVDLAVRQGRIGEARRLITGADFEPFPPLWFFYTPQLTPVRLLLAEKTPESLEAALAALNQLDEFLRRVHRKTVRIVRSLTILLQPGRRYLVHSALALALIHTARGRDEDASSVVESLLSHTMETNDTLGLATVRAFQVDLAVRQGRIGEARRLITGADFESFPPLWFFYTPQLTPVRLLLAEKTPESLEAALAALNQLDEFLRRVHRKTVRIDVLSLQALVLDAKGEEPAALEKVTEALALAEPGGIIRSFVDLGPPMADLLTGLSRDIGNATHLERVLAAFSDPAELGSEGAPRAAEGLSLRATTTPRALDPSALDALTNRELDILELLAERPTNKEIASKLCVSTHTVSYHLKNIYSKLGVSGRRRAVEKAVNRGILRPSSR